MPVHGMLPAAGVMAIDIMWSAVVHLQSTTGGCNQLQLTPGHDAADMLVAQYQQQGQEQQQQQPQQHYPQQVQGYAQQVADPGQVQMPFQPHQAEQAPQAVPDDQMPKPEQYAAAA